VDTPIEYKALNAVDLIVNPPVAPYPPHQVLMAMLTAAIIVSKKPVLSDRAWGGHALSKLYELLRATDFTDEELMDLFTRLNRHCPEIGIPRADELWKFRDDARTPFHVSSVNLLSASVRRLLVLLAFEREAIGYPGMLEVDLEIISLMPGIELMCKLLARSDLGAARQDVIAQLETLLAEMPSTNEFYLQVLGIIVQQKRF
jgi:hypothetical protein